MAPAPPHVTVTRAPRNYLDIVRPDQPLGASGLPSFRTCASSPHREPLTRSRRTLEPSLAILLLGTFGVSTLQFPLAAPRSSFSVPNALAARTFRKKPIATGQGSRLLRPEQRSSISSGCTSVFCSTRACAASEGRRTKRTECLPDRTSDRP
jgi:hypothetical protein